MYRFVDLILMTELNVKLDFKVYCAKIWARKLSNNRFWRTGTKTCCP